MNNIWGLAIPGLAMKADELPFIDGLLRLENPEIGSGPDWSGREYSLIDVASFHAKNIAKLNLSKVVVIGMSMGGMIASIIASNFRQLLPKNSTFRLLVTSANLPDCPAITAQMLQEWSTARRGDFESYKKVLSPFFPMSLRQINRI